MEVIELKKEQKQTKRVRERPLETEQTTVERASTSNQEKKLKGANRPAT